MHTFKATRSPLICASTVAVTLSRPALAVTQAWRQTVISEMMSATICAMAAVDGPELPPPREASAATAVSRAAIISARRGVSTVAVTGMRELRARRVSGRRINLSASGNIRDEDSLLIVARTVPTVVSSVLRTPAIAALSRLTISMSLGLGAANAIIPNDMRARKKDTMRMNCMMRRAVGRRD